LCRPGGAPIEAVRYVVNVEVAVVRGGRYLMIVRGEAVPFSGILAFPGGKMELTGEAWGAIEDTARRELREEVAVEAGEELHYVESHVFTGGGGPVLDVVVLCRHSSGEGHAAAGAEVAAVAWLSADEVLGDPRTQPWTAGSLRLAEAIRRRLGW
jgi:8-oxo-dGTP diphosphatase